MAKASRYTDSAKLSVMELTDYFDVFKVQNFPESDGLAYHPKQMLMDLVSGASDAQLSYIIAYCLATLEGRIVGDSLAKANSAIKRHRIEELKQLLGRKR